MELSLHQSPAGPRWALDGLFLRADFELGQFLTVPQAETAATLVRLKQEKAVEYIAEIIAVRFNLRAANLITPQVIEIRGGMVSAVLYRREITILRRGTLLDHSTVETFGKALSGFEKLVAAVNLLAKLDLLAHDPSLKNVISTIGGLAELLDTFETVRSMTSKWVRYGRELAEDGMTCMIVTHEMGFAREVANQIYFTDGGVLVERGPPKEFFAKPRDPRTQQFLDQIL